MKVNKQNARERIALLNKELELHNKLYYVDNKPVISDFEYDLLLQELEYLEQKFPDLRSKDSPTLKIGSDIDSNDDASNFVRRRHDTPMLSLSNTYNREELIVFDTRIRKFAQKEVEYVCELKIDGSAISLLYENRKLIRAVTRGDGLEGDDVTENIMQLHSIPKVLSANLSDDRFEIRGEIFLTWDNFDKLNIERENEEETLFANPRNAAAGTLKLLDKTVVAERGLSAFFYSINSANLQFETQEGSLKWAEGAGFPVCNKYKLCKSIKEVEEYLNYWEVEREKLPFPTDGVVIKVNSISLQNTLGSTAKSPRWATAYKFKTEQASTQLQSITFQVGRTGAITPVANLKPVLLSGSTVRRASLHNDEQMFLLDIHIGDTVFVEKGGEIIPKIVGVDLSLRDKNFKRAEFPKECPDCGTLLVKESGEARHYCPNINGCPMQIKGRILHFCSRKAMNILAGEATIEQLYSLALVKNISDLYKLDREALLQMEGWKERSVERFIASLERSKSEPFYKVLYALGVRHVGETTAKSLATHFKTISALMAASREELLEAPEVGEIIADSIRGFFSIDANNSIIADLQSSGLIFAEERDHTEPLSQKLKGKTVVISGLFSISREQLKEMVLQHSGKISSSISKSTSFVIAGENMGPSKLQKAAELGVKILTEEEFINLIR